jgi:hypothetical protein
VSDTPRTDAIESRLEDVAFHPEHPESDPWQFCFGGALEHARDLECENSRLRAELAETERKYLDAWRESQIERAAAVAAEAALAEEKRLHTVDCEAHGIYVAATEVEREKFQADWTRLTAELAELRTRNDTQLCTLLKVTGKLQAAEARAESPDHTCHWHDHFVAEAAKCLVAERDLEKERQEHADTQRVGLAAYESLARELEKKTAAYNDLLFQVGQKHPNETRHDTAKRMIVKGEAGCPKCDHGVASAALQPEDKDES